MTDIYLISGFLGAGKTTLMQKLLTQAFQGKKVALVENDFGEVSVDAALLKKGGYHVTQLDAGCICCTLSGDFVAALASLLKTYCPQVVLIEPSGVSKLSEVEKACQDKAIAAQAHVVKRITVLDVKRCKRYLDNFGAFFEDQVSHADTVLFSRTGDFPEKVQEALDIVQRLNPHAEVFAQDWGQLSASALIGTAPSRPAVGHCAACGCHGQHHGAACHCGHHTATQAFDTLTLHFTHSVVLPELTARISSLGAPCYGEVLRAKGIVKGPKGYFHLQYLPGDLKLEETEVSGNALCIIGKGLDKSRISALFAFD